MPSPSARYDLRVKLAAERSKKFDSQLRLRLRRKVNRDQSVEMTIHEESCGAPHRIWQRIRAFGISGFAGEFSTPPSYQIGQEGAISGSMGWSRDNQILIVVGVVSLIYGVILRKDSK